MAKHLKTFFVLSEFPFLLILRNAFLTQAKTKNSPSLKLLDKSDKKFFVSLINGLTKVLPVKHESKLS